jgi:hypothetical protein
MPAPLEAAHSPEEREALIGAFLFCAQCAVAHRITRADQAAVFLPDGTPSAADDYQLFLDAHPEHPLQLLRRTSDAEMLSHPRWDPMCRVSWELTDGENDYVVTFGRSDVNGPREYGISRGRMILDRETVEVDIQALHRVIDEALYPLAAPARKIEALIASCRRLIGATPIERFEPLDESRDDANVQLACLPPSVAGALRAELFRVFSGMEAERLVDIMQHDLRTDIPIVRLTRRYRIETERARP